MQIRASASVIATCAVFVLAASAPASAYRRLGVTERVSVASDGSQGTAVTGGAFQRSALSSTGRYVVFTSPLNSLDTRDQNLSSSSDLFWHDRVSGRTELIPINDLGLQSGPPLGCVPPQTGASPGHPMINGSGRLVAFETDAQDIAPFNGIRDTDCADDVFVRDMVTGKVDRISVAHNGGPATGGPGSWNPAISASGRYVAFQSSATNLVKNDTGGVHHVYVRDRTLNKTQMVDVSSSGARANDGVGDATVSISRNGRWVIFQSSASNLVPNDTNDAEDVFVRDLKTKKTFRVSLRTGGLEAESGGGLCNVGRQAISNNGRRFVFCSGSSDLVPNRSNRNADIYVYDLDTKRSERVSVSSTGAEAQGNSSLTSISGNGRVIAFGSTANNIVPGDTGQTCLGPFITGTPAVCLPESLTGGDGDVFFHDFASGATYMASVAPDGAEATGCTGGLTTAFFPTLDEQGDTMAFASCASNLVSDDTNLATDTFVREIGRDLGAVVQTTSGMAPRSTSIGLRQSLDAPSDALIPGRGAEIIGVKLAHRPALGDLYLKIDVDRMPGPRLGVGTLAGDPAVVYGAAMKAADRRYEVRIAKNATGRDVLFGLFECSAGPCVQIASLKGGYGTVGESVVVSIPTDLISAGSVDSLEVTAFSALGTYATGAVSLLDEAPL